MQQYLVGMCWHSFSAVRPMPRLQAEHLDVTLDGFLERLANLSDTVSSIIGGRRLTAWSSGCGAGPAPTTR